MGGMPDEFQLPLPTTYSGQQAGAQQHHAQQQQQQHAHHHHQYHQQSNNPFLNLPAAALSHSTPAIALHQQSSPRASSMYTPSGTSGLPGSLQPASGAVPSSSSSSSAANPASSSGRPGPPQSSYTTPVVPHINTNAQQYTLPTRSNTVSQAQSASHSYSRSSPAGLTEQKYIPFSATTPGAADLAKIPQTPQQKSFFSPQTPTGPALASMHSPLVLEQIRPRANSNMDEVNAFGGDIQATNSNYLAPWAVFAFDWCKYPVLDGNSAGKMAIGSYLEDPHNFIQIIETSISPQDNGPGYGIEYNRVAEATCSYPVTRILWEPPISQKQSTDLLATSGDHLRLWSLPSSASSAASNNINRSASVNTRDPPPQKLTPLALLSNSKTPEHTAPLTSLDWNTLSPKLIITSSIDTTCTIWDIPTLTAKTQLIAHDKEVYDVRFCAGSVDVFVSCGADGSVRMFDLRSLEHSTIIYEPSEKNPQDARTESTPPSPSKSNAQTLINAPPLLRLAASPHDSHLLATFAADSNITRILDVRQPGQALLELRGHTAAINAVEWSPSRRGVLATGGDDGLVLIWDLLNAGNGASLNGVGGGGGGGAVANNGVAVTAVSAAGTGGAGSAGAGVTGGAGTAAAAAAGAGAANQQAPVGAKGPASWWRCDYEVGNLSWAPQSGLTSQGGEWLGVGGGKGIWGVKL